MIRIIPSHEFRRRARAAMKPVLSTLVVIALILTLPSLIQSLVITLTDASPVQLLQDVSNRLMQIAETPNITESQALAALEEAMTAYEANMMTFYREKGPLLGAMALVILLITPVLSLGMSAAVLHALRKQPFTVGIVVSRMRYFLKALGLDLLITLKACLWAFPGMAVMIVSAFLPAGVMSLGMLAGMALMVVQVVRAVYLYALSFYFLADDPAKRVRDCICASKAAMKGRRMELFLLEISFIGWSLLISLGQSFAMGLLGSAIGMTLGMFASLFLTVYTKCATGAFYLEYALGPVDASAPQDAASAGDEIL